MSEDRLFVALNTRPYRDFERGAKTWELRGVNDQFNRDTVYPGRRVEFRRGYSTGDSLWGTIVEVETVAALGILTSVVDPRKIVPGVTPSEFEQQVRGLFDTEYDQWIAFRPDLDAVTDGGSVEESLTDATGETCVGHCRHDDHDVYVGRGDRGDAHLLNTEIGDRGWLGNPFTVEEFGREECVERYRRQFEARLEDDPEFRAAVRELAGSVLGCWCQRLDDDGPLCHGSVVAEHADRLADTEEIHP